MDSYIRVPLALCLAATTFTAGLIAYAFAQKGEEVSASGLLERFSSYEELEQFLADARHHSNGQGGYLIPEFGNHRESASGPGLLNPHGYGSEDNPSYSATNVQVAGVDEADIVKTDGRYLYIASGDKVAVVRAYPPAEMANVTMLEPSEILGFEPGQMDVYITGIYLAGDRLVVVVRVYPRVNYCYCELDEALSTLRELGDYPRVVISVIDVQVISSPKLLWSVGVSGYDLTSRMVGDYVYLVAASSIWQEGEIVLPSLWDGSTRHMLKLDDIYYDPETRDASGFTTLLVIDTRRGGYEVLTLLSGYFSTIYMSSGALYLTVQKWSGEFVLLGSELAPAREWEHTTRTTVFKVAIEGLSMVNVARGEVRGWLLNQFSMDEHEGYLRVATTTSWTNPENAVYVLDGNLSVVGALEGLAPSERIYSARFLGDTLYLVTFRQTDPLFVIDLAIPSSPRVVGQLELPGFSSYLHPVGDDYVLGLGSENGSVKLSLFNVSDPAAPREESRFLAPSGSYSLAQYDYKAFLFDLDSGLLVVPMICLSGEPWSGAYVFRVTPEDGIAFIGAISHGDLETRYDPVLRAVFIGDVLYTLSAHSVVATSLSDLFPRGELVYLAISSCGQPW